MSTTLPARSTGSSSIAETRAARLAHHARHVDRGQKRRERADGPEKFAERRRRKTKRRRAPCLPENLVLRKETGEDWNAADREPPRHHRRERDGHVLLEPAHAPHVLLVVHAVNYRAGTKEQQRLEECVRDDVKARGDKRAHTARQEHVTELRNGRVSQNFLDVVLRETDRSGKESGGSADDGDDKHRGRRVYKDL